MRDICSKTIALLVRLLLWMLWIFALIWTLVFVYNLYTQRPKDWATFKNLLSVAHGHGVKLVSFVMGLNKGMLWGIPAGLVVVVVVYLIVLRLRKRRSDSPYLQDAPLGLDEGVDEIGREGYVNQLESLIRYAPAAGQAQYIGVYGSWGCGKTSVVNLLRRRLRNDSSIHFVLFSPWMYVGSKDWPARFVETVVDGVCHGRLGLQTIRARFLASRLALRELGVHLKGAHWISSIILFIFRPLISLDGIRHELCKLMANMRCRLVVVIDDLERMYADEVNSMIRILKANVDFPGVTYLILADPQYLELAVGVKMPPLINSMNSVDVHAIRTRGRYFLEKIIPTALPLQEVVTSCNLEEIFSRMLCSLVGRFGGAEDDVKQLDLTCARMEVGDIRQMKRLLNAIASGISLQRYKDRDSQRLSTNLSDLVALSVMREFERDFFDRVSAAYWLVVERQRSVKLDVRCNRKWLDALLRNCQNREACEYFLVNHLGFVLPEGRKDEVKCPNADMLCVAADYRLSSAFSHDNYFSGEVPKWFVAQEYFDRFQKLLYFPHADERIKSLLEDVDKQNRLAPFLLLLREKVILANKQYAENLLRIVISMCNLKWVSTPLPEKIVPPSIDTDVYKLLLSCALYVRSGMGKDDFATKDAWDRALADRADDFVLLGRWIMEDMGVQPFGDYVKRNEHYVRMFLSRLAENVRRGRKDIQKGVDWGAKFGREWVSFVYALQDRLLAVEFAILHLEYVDDPLSVQCVLMPFVHEYRLSTGVREYHVEIEMLHWFYADDDVERIIQSAASSPSVSDEVFRAVISAQKLFRSGADCSRDAQVAETRKNRSACRHRISVIVFQGGESRFLSQTLESLISSLFARRCSAELEIVCPPDSAVSGAQNRVQKLGLDQRCKIRPLSVNCARPDAGVVYRNRALDMITGQYLVWMNAGDTVSAMWLPTLIDDIRRTGADIILSGASWSFPSGCIVEQMQTQALSDVADLETRAQVESVLWDPYPFNSIRDRAFRSSLWRGFSFGTLGHLPDDRYASVKITSRAKCFSRMTYVAYHLIVGYRSTLQELDFRIAEAEWCHLIFKHKGFARSSAFGVKCQIAAKLMVLAYKARQSGEFRIKDELTKGLRQKLGMPLWLFSLVTSIRFSSVRRRALAMDKQRGIPHDQIFDEMRGRCFDFKCLRPAYQDPTGFASL